MRKIFIMILLTFLTIVASAQNEMMTEHINLEAEDGLMLVADLYYPQNAQDAAPAVLLLHMLGSERSAYEPLIPALLDAGYVVLNTDMRGHGETGGDRDWPKAETDTLAWLAWLRQQEGVQADAVSIIGASIGANLALMGCAADAACLTAIALSPGQDYRGVQPEDAITNGLAERSALLIAAHGDGYSADTIRAFFSGASGNISARLYTGRAHGTNLFDDTLDSVSRVIVAWLDEHVATLAN